MISLLFLPALAKRVLPLTFCALVATALTTVTSVAQAAPNDFNLDNKSDLVLSNANGLVDLWLMNGTAVTSRTTLLNSPGWAVSHLADFNGDGKTDILWRNVNGAVTLWLMDGPAVTSAVGLIGADANWSVTHTGDFNGDGKADILWRNTNGAVTVWLMNGSAVTLATGLLGANPDWRVTHVADLNGDKNADLIWRNTNGAVTVWTMNGATIAASAGLIGPDPGWSVSHTADFNGDGKADILWRNTNGAVTAWLMNGTTVASTGGLLGPDPSWSVSHTADFNGDGKADLLWRNTNGAVTIWTMNGIAITATAGILGADANWRITHISDLNGDGKSDLLWRNLDGSITAWLMNGTTTAAVTTLAGTGNLFYVQPSAIDDAPAVSGKRWSDAATWGGVLPAAGSVVTIPRGWNVLLDVSPPALKGITIEGQLTFDSSKDISLSADWIVATGVGAKLEIGTAATPYIKRATITLTGANTLENIAGMGTKLLGAMLGAKIEIMGERRVSWTQLAATATIGATQITLKEPVDWRVGERLVIASSSLNPDEVDERNIAAVSADRLKVTLDRALQYQHFGQLQTFDGRSLDERAEVGLLSRNIVIQGDDASAASRFGGHVMIMGADANIRETNPQLRSSAKIRGVEFRRMGQFDHLGRYPLHWHRNGTSDGDFVEGSAVHQSFQRGVVVHSSDSITARDNVVYGTPGHSYVVEDGTERGNVFIRNLGLLPQAATFTVAGLKDQNDQGAANFWLRTAAVTLTDNASAGGPFAGFWFDMGFIDGANVTKTKLQFMNNTVHSHRSGKPLGGDGFSWAIWHTDGFVPSEEGVLQFDKVTAYKNTRAIETLGRGITNDSILAGNEIAISNSLIKNSVIVSRSANTDTNERWGQTGLFAYGGFANAENVTWIGFNNGREIITTLACGIEFPRFATRGAKLIDSEPTAGCGDSIITDTDGTLSGKLQPGKLVNVGAREGFLNYRSNPYGLVTSECEIRTPQSLYGVALCPNYDYRALRVTYPTGSGFANPDWRVDVVRAADSFRQTPDHFRWAAYVIPEWSYRLEIRNQRNLADQTSYPLTNLADITLALGAGDVADANLLSGGSAYTFDSAAQNRTVTLYAAAPTSTFRIRACLRTSTQPCPDNSGTWPQIAAAASLNALQASTSAGYFVDQASARIYFKLFGDDVLKFER